MVIETLEVTPTELKKKVAKKKVAKKKVVKKKVVKKKAVRKPRKKNYINNADLLIELEKSNAQGQMTNNLVLMLQELCRRYATKGNFINYTYNEDMQAYAMMMLVRSWYKFNAEISKNPFAFFTQCTKNFFRQYLNQEKKHRDIRDELLVKSGLTPSFNYQLACEESARHSGEDCFDEANVDSTPVVVEDPAEENK